MKHFIENPDFQEQNQQMAENLSTSPAILANGEEGVAIFLNRFIVCLSAAGGIDLANKIVEAIDAGKEVNQK